MYGNFKNMNFFNGLPGYPGSNMSGNPGSKICTRPTSTNKVSLGQQNCDLSNSKKRLDFLKKRLFATYQTNFVATYQKFEKQSQIENLVSAS